MIYILLLIVLGLAVAWFLSRKSNNEKEDEVNRPDDCCGAHEVCENDSLLSASDKIEYYNDEELDRFKGLSPKEYSTEAIDEFRDVLYTLKEHEVSGWMKSMQIRCINLPEIIREEALMIVEERRMNT